MIALLHELGHILAALILGYKLVKIRFLSIGVNAVFEKTFRTKNHSIVIALAGPLVNLVLIVVLLYFKDDNLINDLIASNIYMLILNLLPLEPLDGGRIITASGLPHFAVNLIKFIAYTVIVVSMYLSFTQNKTINISLLLIVFFLFFSDKKCYSLKEELSNDISLIKGDTKVIELIKCTDIMLVYDKNNIIGVLENKDIYSAAEAGFYYTNVKDLLFKITNERTKNDTG